MRIVTRPLVAWPGEPNRSHAASPFSANWTSSMDLLFREADHLGASEVVLQLALTEADIRLDGWPYAHAKPTHPGVVVSLEGKQGPLSFPCDRFTHWQDNVRAVALGMEALRKVDRYGITKTGQQYDGWKALGSGTPMPAAAMTGGQAMAFISKHAGISPPLNDGDDAPTIRDAYRSAAKRLHPDAGGDADLFKRLTEAMAVLGLAS